MKENCEQGLARLKIQVPDKYSLDAFRERVLEVLLYPNSTIIKEKDGTYSIKNPIGDKINNVDIETVIECKKQSTILNLKYVRLEGMPSKIDFNEIVLYKPSTKETKTINVST